VNTPLGVLPPPTQKPIWKGVSSDGPLDPLQLGHREEPGETVGLLCVSSRKG